MDNVILQEAALPQKKQRDSSIELLRIITMFVIVAHHYVVNSGLMEVIAENGAMKGSSLFLLLFGWGGKTGINCFVMITGYFMCKSNITLKKFLKLLLEVEFYKILFYLIFLITGYSTRDWIHKLLHSIFSFYPFPEYSDSAYEPQTTYTDAGIVFIFNDASSYIVI